MPTDNDTRIALLEFQAKQTQDNLSNLSVDVREMKDALLKTLTRIDSRTAQDDAMSQRMEKFEEAMEKLKAGYWKAAGIVGLIQFVGLPAVYLVLSKAQ